MSALNASSLSFPVLRFNDAHIRKFKTRRELGRMTQRHFERGDFKQRAFLIDSSGRRFSITDVQKIGRSWHPAFWFAPSPAILVELSVGEPVQLSLHEIKTVLVDLVCRNRWYQQGGETEAEFRKAFDELRSLPEVMENVSFYGNWQG